MLIEDLVIFVSGEKLCDGCHDFLFWIFGFGIIILDPMVDEMFFEVDNDLI